MAPAHFLLTHFDRLAEAPGGIAKLRALLMQLAVEGKLGTQNPEDEPASKFRDRIAAEKKRLIANGKLGRDKEWPQDEDSAPIFNLPASWVFSTLGEIGSINPRNEADDDQDASFVPMKLINAELRQPHGHEIRKWAEIKKGFTHFAEGDVTLAKITPCFENRKSSVMRGLANGIGAGTTELHVVRPVLVDPDYILIFLKSPLFVEAGIPEMTGTAGQKRVPTSYFAATPFPLPPLAEQRRILAKVEELMGLCDALEAAQREREAVRTRLRTSALYQLTSPDSDPKSADFVLKNLPRLTAATENLSLLRDSICRLAIHGDLLPQSKKDESAAALLSRIEKWNQREIEAGTIRAPRKDLRAIGNADHPYQLPNGWEWARLGEIIYIRSGEGLTKENMVTGNVPVFGGNGITGYHDQPNVERETIVIGRVGYYCGSIHLTPSRAWVTDNAFVTHYCTEEIHREFLLLLLRNTNLKEDEKATAQPVISGSKVYPIVVGIPPLAEQRRIVAKVDELMAVLDALEATLTTARTASEQLLAATIAKLHAA